MSWIDKKHILEISSSLEHFKQRKENLFSFRCPYCGDSQKKKFKTRGFIYEKTGEYYMRCHNCGYGTNLGNFIKYLDPLKYRHYVMEKFGNSREELRPLKTEFKHIIPIFKNKIDLQSINELESNHWVVEYVENRKISAKFYSDLYFAPSFKAFVDDLMPNHDKDLIENDIRLVIPFYNENNDLIGFQGRALNSNKIRYITIKLHNDFPKVFGLNRVNKNKIVYVLEGPIDSMMLENAIAVCDSNLRSASKYVSKENLVLVFDNQYHNREVRQQIQRSIDEGFAVCLFPKITKEKDLNEMVMNGMSYVQIETCIHNNTFSGLRAKFEFNRLKG